jgi:hypothetical protein
VRAARNASKRLSAPLAQYPRGCDRRGQAPDRYRPEVLVVEQPAGQPLRAGRDHHRPRLGQRLQPRRQVGRLADNTALARFALADQITDHDETGGYPDPRLQRCSCRRVEPAYRLDQRQPGPHRPLGIVLVGARIAEIGKHAVAHVFGDKPAAALNDRGDAAMITADHRAQILGVEPHRQSRRIDQIAEHDCELAALSLANRRGDGSRCGAYRRLG